MKKIISFSAAMLLLFSVLSLFGCGKSELSVDGMVLELDRESGCYTIISYIGNAEELTLATSYEGVAINSVGDHAFYGNTTIRTLTVPQGFVSIGKSAFRKCEALTSVSLPASLLSLGTRAFFDCRKLAEFNVAPGCTACASRDGVLYSPDMTVLLQYPVRSANTDFTVPDGVSSIGEYAFLECSSLNSVKLSPSVTAVGDYAFNSCTGLTELDLASAVTVGAHAFESCTSLKSIKIPDSITALGENAFSRCTEATVLTLGDGLTVIGPYAFSGCISLPRLIVGKNVTSVESGAFSGCSSIKYIEIYKSLTSIATSAFGGCTDIDDIFFEGTAAEWGAVKIESGNMYIDGARMSYNFDISAYS